MRILVKWYFNELLGYLIMSFSSTPVIANDKNKPVFFLLLKCFMWKLLPKENKKILSSNHMILTNCRLVTYITNRNGQKTEKDEFKVTVSLLFQRLT